MEKLLQAASYVVMLLVRFKLNPALGPPIRGITWRERFVSLEGVWGMIVLILLVMGSMYPGIATPTEAAGVVRMADIFRGCGWFVFVDIINVAILLAFPAIILLIPSTMIR